MLHTVGSVARKFGFTNDIKNALKTLFLADKWNEVKLVSVTFIPEFKLYGCHFGSGNNGPNLIFLHAKLLDCRQSLKETLYHELTHLIVDKVYDREDIEHHGAEFNMILRAAFGLDDGYSNKKLQKEIQNQPRDVIVSMTLEVEPDRYMVGKNEF